VGDHAQVTLVVERVWSLTGAGCTLAMELQALTAPTFIRSVAKDWFNKHSFVLSKFDMHRDSAAGLKSPKFPSL